MMPFQAQDELRKQAKFSKIIKFVGHNVSVIALNSNGRDIIGVLSFRDYTGYVFDSVFVRHVDRETLVKEYFSLEEKLYHTVAGVRDKESQLRDTLYINDFANIAEGLPNDTGIIVNVSTNEKLTLSLERLKKKSNEEALLKKIEGNPVFIDIHVISTDPRETYLLRETITRNSNIDLAWMQINPISPLEVRNLIEPQIYRRGSILQRFWEGKLLSPTTTVAELMEWLELPIPSRVIDYFRNSFKIKRESGITIGKLMNDRDYKIAASDYPVYVYAESRLGRDVIKILAHNVSNPIVVDIVGTVSEELAKETQLPFLMPPFFGLNPLVKSQPVIEGVLRILKVEDPLLQRTFEGLVNALPDPTIPKIYKLLYETLHADIIPYTTENWVTYLAEFKKLRYKRALHLLTVLGRVVNVRDIRLTLSEDTINTDDLKSGAIISIPAHKYSPRLASIVASLLILRLWNDLKNTVFLINAGTEHLPVLKYLISDLGFKRVVYVTSSPRLPAHFKTRLYEFKKKNIMFLDGYLTLVYVKKAEYPIIREKVAPEKLIPAEPELPELPIEPTKTRERMNGVLRLMIDSEFVELDELLERVRSVEGIVMSPTPSEIESFLKNLEEELRKVHRSDLGFRLTQIAYLHYVKKGFLDVRPAAQRPDTIRPDLEIPSKHIVVEVEAENVSKAVEQVKRNMLKWKDVTRVWEVHVWTNIDDVEKIYSIYASLPSSAKEKVRIHTIDFEEQRIYTEKTLEIALEIAKKRRMEKEVKSSSIPSRPHPKIKKKRKKAKISDGASVTLFEFADKDVYKEVGKRSEEEEKVITIRDKRTNVEYEVVIDLKGWEHYTRILKTKKCIIRVDEKNKVIRVMNKSGNRIGMIKVKEIRKK